MAGGAGGGGAGVQVGRLGGGEGSVGGGGRTVGAFVVGDHTGSGGCATPEIAVQYLAICRNLYYSSSYLSGFGGFVVRTLAIGKVVVLFRL